MPQQQPDRNRSSSNKRRGSIGATVATSLTNRNIDNYNIDMLDEFDSGHGSSYCSIYSSLDESVDLSYELAAYVRGVSRTVPPVASMRQQRQLLYRPINQLQRYSMVGVVDTTTTERSSQEFDTTTSLSSSRSAIHGSMMDYHASSPRDDNDHNIRNSSAMRQRGVDQSIALPPECHLMRDANDAMLPFPTRVNIETLNGMAQPESHQEGMYNTNTDISNINREESVNVFRENVQTPMAPIVTTISPMQPRGRKIISPTKSSILSPTTTIVSPEVTRPITMPSSSSSNKSSGTTSYHYYNNNNNNVTSLPQMPPIISTPTSQSPPKRYRSGTSTTVPLQQSSVPSALSSPNTVRSVLPRVVAMSFSTNETNQVMSNSTYTTPETARSSAMSASILSNNSISSSHCDREMSSQLPTQENGALEIAPGVTIHLRGARETQHAINTGFYIQCECMICSISTNIQSCRDKSDEIYCILDCDYFICPKCRSVQPNPLSSNTNTTPIQLSSGTKYPGGLGLGFRLENGKYRP